jgi:hypothetical protein
MGKNSKKFLAQKIWLFYAMGDMIVAYAAQTHYYLRGIPQNLSRT